MVSELVPQLPTPEQREARALWHKSESEREPFQALVDSTVADVLGDALRSWDAYAHITLLNRVRREHDRRAEAAKRREQDRRILECPVCHEWNGGLATRPLLPNHIENGRHYTGRGMIRSCAPCWHEAVALERELRSRLADGRTRAQAVATYLNHSASREA